MDPEAQKHTGPTDPDADPQQAFFSLTADSDPGFSYTKAGTNSF